MSEENKQRTVVREEDVPKSSRDRHMRVVEDALSKERFEGIHVITEFQDPAFICVFKEQPSKHVYNILGNTLDVQDEEAEGLHFYIYFADTKEGWRWGKIRENIEDIYKISEIFEKYKMKMFEVKEGQRREVKPSDYIHTMEI